jgi:hypothetical protein
MIKNYILYFKTCPGVQDPKHFKVGITQLTTARSRLATYQNAVGPVWEEKFLRIWLGDENQIRLAEKAFKRNYKDKILSAEAGLSEWICEIELKELIAFTEELRNEYFIKFINVPLEFEPLTMPMCEDLAEWYESQPKDIDD